MIAFQEWPHQITMPFYFNNNKFFSIIILLIYKYMITRFTSLNQ